MFKVRFLLLFFAVLFVVSCSKDWSADEKPDKWINYSKDKLDQILNRKINGQIAKNILIYLGDGMGVSTVTVKSLKNFMLSKRK